MLGCNYLKKYDFFDHSYLIRHALLMKINYQKGLDRRSQKRYFSPSFDGSIRLNNGTLGWQHKENH